MKISPSERRNLVYDSIHIRLRYAKNLVILHFSLVDRLAGAR
jgi:hypothetical protein